MPPHSIDISETKGVRTLHFGSSWVQGAMRLARPWALELAYTRDMMAGLLLRDPATWPRSALLIGLGAASQVRFIHRHLPDCAMTAIEISPGVIAAARQYFKLDECANRLDLILGDAAEEVGTLNASYDLILADGFDAEGNSGALGGSDFLAACRERLSPEGIFSYNLLTREKSAPRLRERLAATFPAACTTLPTVEGNAVVLASHNASQVSLPLLQERAAAIREKTTLDFAPLLSRMADAGLLSPAGFCLSAPSKPASR